MAKSVNQYHLNEKAYVENTNQRRKRKMKIKYYNKKIRVLQLQGKSKGKYFIIDAGINRYDRVAHINKALPFRCYFSNIVHEFGHAIIYNIEEKFGLKEDRLDWIHRIWDILGALEEYLKKSERWMFAYD